MAWNKDSTHIDLVVLSKGLLRLPTSKDHMAVLKFRSGIIQLAPKEHHARHGLAS